MTQGIFVGHLDRTGAVLCISENWVVRGKSWTRQTLSATNWDGLCATPSWQMVAPEFKLTKKVTADEGAEHPLPRIVVERTPETEPRRFFVLSADIEAHGHTEAAQNVQRLHRMEKRQSHVTMNAERESERSLREL